MPDRCTKKHVLKLVGTEVLDGDAGGDEVRGTAMVADLRKGWGLKLDKKIQVTQMDSSS